MRETRSGSSEYGSSAPGTAGTRGAAPGRSTRTATLPGAGLSSPQGGAGPFYPDPGPSHHVDAEPLAFVDSLLVAGATASPAARVSSGLRIRFRPARLAFPSAVVGKQSSQQVVVINDGDAAIEIDDIDVQGEGLAAWITGPRVLEPDQESPLLVSFRADKAGPLAGRVTLLDENGAGASMIVTGDARVSGPQLPEPEPSVNDGTSKPVAPRPTSSRRPRPEPARKAPTGSPQLRPDLELVDAAFALAARVAERTYSRVHLAELGAEATAAAERGAAEVEQHLHGARASLAAVDGLPDPDRADWALYNADLLASDPAVPAHRAHSLRAAIDVVTALLARRGHANAGEDAERPAPATFDGIVGEAGERSGALRGALELTRDSMGDAMRGGDGAGNALTKAGDAMEYALALLEQTPVPGRAALRTNIESVSAAIEAFDHGLRDGSLAWHGRYVVLVNREARARALVGAPVASRVRSEPHRSSTPPPRGPTPPSPEPAGHRPQRPARARAAQDSLVHKVQITPGTVELATVVGRSTAPVEVRFLVPGQPKVGPQGEIESADLEAAFEAEIIAPPDVRSLFHLRQSEGILWPALSGPSTTIPISFSPRQEGTFKATLQVRMYERGGAGGERVHDIQLSGTALPGVRPGPVDGDGKLDGPPQVTEPPPADVARTPAGTRQALLTAADSLASLGTVHEWHVPQLSAVAHRHTTQLAQVAGKFVERLMQWQGGEAREQMRAMKDGSSNDFADFMISQGIAGADAMGDVETSTAVHKRVGQVTRNLLAKHGKKIAAAAAGGPELFVAAIAVDLFFTYLGPSGDDARNKAIDGAIAENELVTRFMSRAGGAATTAAIEHVSKLTAWFAGVKARLASGLTRSQATLREIGRVLAQPDVDANVAHDALARATESKREFDVDLAELGHATQAIAGTSIRAPAASERAMSALLEEFLVFKAGGKAPGPDDQSGYRAPLPVRLGGNLNMSNPERLVLTVTQVRFGKYAPRGAEMLQHVGEKTWRMLEGWDVQLELTLDDGSTVRLYQSESGTRSLKGSARALAISDQVWRILDTKPMNELWMR